MTGLAWMYEQGRGVDADLAQALYWYERGAAAGSESAARAVRRLQPEP
jgi:TPR repeat protein